jgi:hypothetical protein
MTAIRNRLTYSNLIATIALFIALGGSAYALSKDSVKSKHIVNDEVKSADLRNDGIKSGDLKDEDVKGRDIEDGEITGDDVDESTLYPGGGLPGQGPYDIPIGGLLSAQVRNIGGDGAVLYGGLNGRSTANADLAEVATGKAVDTAELGQMWVSLEAPLGVGQSRTFTVVRSFDFGSVLQTSVSCTIGPGERLCEHMDATQTNNPILGILIESTGPGLSPTDLAYIGLAIKQKANL